MNTQTLSIQAASRHGPLPFALAALTVAVAAMLAPAAQAAEAASPWLVRAGLSQIAPKSGNGQLAVGSVPGLSFDATTAAVVFRAQGKTIECATVKERGRWLFKHSVIEPTGRCELTHKYVDVAVDNGFAIEEIQHFEVHFNPDK